MFKTPFFPSSKISQHLQGYLVSLLTNCQHFFFSQGMGYMDGFPKNSAFKAYYFLSKGGKTQSKA